MSNGTPPSPPPSTPPAEPPITPSPAPAPSPAPSAPAEKSPEDIEKELSKAKKEAGAAVGMAVLTEGAAAPEAAAAAAKVKALEKALKEAKEREKKAKAGVETATAATDKSNVKKLLAQPAVILIVGIFAFLYLRFSGYTTLSNWVGISVLGSVVIGVIFKEPKKGFIFLLLPFMIGFLDYLKMLTPMNTILTVSFTAMVMLLSFDVARQKINVILNFGVYMIGGFLIFFLSAWAQMQLGTSFPHIITTILILCYFVFVLVAQKKFYVKFLAVMINVCFFVVIFSVPTLIGNPDSAVYNAVIAQRDAWINMYSSGITAGKQVVKGVETQYLYALGDYEEGVEAQSERPLGVFLENVGVTAKFVSILDTVDVFARLRAESFKTDRPLKISVACYPEDKPDIFGDITPRAAFEVEEYESQEIDCLIDADELGAAATHNIFLEASFSFTTGSFLTTYFMPQERIRAYMRQHPEPNANPLDQWQITNKNPIAVYTGGPLKIGLGVG
ncbi:hypothetical protein KY319_02745, partial [Candidatus Woesearchaeota archaeon]|nr:hypothetical protein [Candidatus Woesearchaeota archaeon]